MKKEAKTAVKTAEQTSTAEADSKREAAVSVMNDLAGQLRCKVDNLRTILRNTVFRSCKRPEEFMSACMVAREYKLNPILKEIYAFPSQNGVVPIVSIDGWIRIINSHPKYAGCKFKYTGSVKEEGVGDLACTCVIYRTDRKEPIEVQEFYEECYRDTDPWNDMPRRMLRWKSLIQCARVAFGFAGIYDFDEGNDILSHDNKRVTKDGEIIDAEVAELGGDAGNGEDKVLPDEPDPTEDDADETEERERDEGDEDSEDEPTDPDDELSEDLDEKEVGMPW